MEENTNNSKEDSKNLPKKKRNIGCGIVLILMSLGALQSTTQGSGGNISFLFGKLIAFFLFVYFGIRMIKGKEINNKKD